VIKTSYSKLLVQIAIFYIINYVITNQWRSQDILMERDEKNCFTGAFFLLVGVVLRLGVGHGFACVTGLILMFTNVSNGFSYENHDSELAQCVIQSTSSKF